MLSPPPVFLLCETQQHPHREGKIVPAQVTVGLLQKAMKESGKSRFLIDGFPRNPENLAAWEAAAAEAEGGIIFDFALCLDCPEEVKRIKGLSALLLGDVFLDSDCG